jgi:predicted ArsR family transcriptional regulator
VRQHLERLRVAGLVSRERVPSTRGRPRYGWRLTRDARAASEAPDAYRGLALWLARSIPARPGRLRELERSGRELGRELAHETGEPAVQSLRRTLEALGFAPRTARSAPGRVTFRLDNCPYRAAARGGQAVVCTLHRGITRGLLDRLAPSAELVRFTARDPVRAGCEIEIAGIAGD